MKVRQGQPRSRAQSLVAPVGGRMHVEGSPHAALPHEAWASSWTVRLVLFLLLPPARLTLLRGLWQGRPPKCLLLGQGSSGHLP